MAQHIKFLTNVFAIGLIELLSLLSGLLITAQTGSAQPESNVRRTVWEGVYTTAQAAKGKAAYDKSCVECHRSDLGGSSGVLVNPRLLEHWREDNLYSFFNVMKGTMPRGAPASLTDEAYVEILAFILHANNFPVGADELKLEKLPHIQMEAKSGPQDLPPGSLVHVIGCLTQRYDNAWILERSSKLIRTRNPDGSTKDELKVWQNVPLGPLKFNLMAAEIYGAASRKGHKVEAKGFLIKNATDQSINLTALQTIDSTCEP